MLRQLNERMERYAERKLAAMSEVERRDARAFDEWFIRRGGWKWLIWIGVAATLVAAVASQLPWNLRFVPAAIMFNGIAYALLWAGFVAWFGYRRLQGKLLRVTGACLLTVAIIAPLVVAAMEMMRGRPPFAWLTDSALLRHLAVATFLFAFLYVSVVALISTFRNREHIALARHLEAEARRSELSRRLAESELKLLQSQIEPHFLFNTLGSAQQLAEKGAPDAARLIGDLIRFLRAATPSLRREATTLDDEARLVGAYLAIMRTRFGTRLRYSIDVPAALRSTPLPSGMLITLVENAVKHGIEPLPEGGEIVVSAHDRSDGRLEVRVADTGAGLGTQTPGQGIGLANIRERIAMLYGDGAALELEENVPRGFVARLLLPVERAAMHPAAALRSEELQ
ncbi:MAG TPA: histidine kinase [Casimicrobiaceae bacterium]|nr:histidine kinase [Casimicrobiaceae bacterium]